MKKYQEMISLIVFVLATALLSVSCNKDFVKVLPNKDFLDTATVSYGQRKVLYLIVDGARGESVNAAAVPNIKALLPNSIYSWVALSDPDSTRDISNWANMLTGVKYYKHNVVSDDLAGNNLASYPVLFDRIKGLQPNNKIVSFASSALFKSKLTEGTDVSESFATDAETKEAVINSLNTDTASFIVGEFNAIDKAGTQYGYDNSFPQYKAAIQTFDGYVGEIMTALKNRENYKNEDWLVVIASNGGGKFVIPANQNDNTVFSNTAANAFTVYYNAKYKQRVIGKPFTGNRYLGRTVRLQGENIRAEVDTATSDLFNLSDTSTFTIEFKIKKNQDEAYYPSILGKRREWSGGHPSIGWVIYLEQKYWQFEMRGKRNSNDYHQTRGGDLRKGYWENITVKGEIRAGRQYIRCYTNGVFNSEMDITDFGTMENHDLLKLGFLNGNGHGNPDVYVSDIRFFKIAVPDAVIANYACQTSIDEGHPYYNFLLSYWPATDGAGDIIADLGPAASDFKLKGNYQWEDFNDIICPPSASTLAVFVPQTSDIPSQIINWFRIANQQRWNLDGRVWLDQ